jgi:GR25 family glycosyltransferase involved in LPS biosynthesis
MDLFDSIFCINLKERKDRYEQSKQMFEKLNIPVEYWFVDKHPQSGQIGCFESHINVVKESYHRGDNYVLIFEDDIVNTSSFNKTVMKDISEYLKKSKCEYFQLGYSILVPEELFPYYSASKAMIRNTCIVDYNGMLCHSYILSRSGMKKIIDNYETEINTSHIDVYYKELFYKKTGKCVCPTLFEQDFCMKSDYSPPNNAYLWVLRKLSCLQTMISLFYILSCLKRYSFYLWIILILLLFLKYNKYNKYKWKKIFSV